MAIGLLSSLFLTPSIADAIDSEKQQEVVVSADKPLRIAHDYLENGEFDDAYKWYDRVVKDFPNTEYAANAQFQKYLIDLSKMKLKLVRGSVEFKLATNYLHKANEYSSNTFKLIYLEESLKHHENAISNFEYVVEMADVLYEDFSSIDFEELDKISAEPISNISDDLDDEKMLLIQSYNSLFNDIKDGDKFDKHKNLFLTAELLDYNKEYKSKVDEIYNQILEERKNIPYDKLSYEIEERLKEKRNYEVFDSIKKGRKALESLIKLIKVSNDLKWRF